ncbi:hypothetical protein ACLVWU_00765 [Bdellovibrio sp. HCB290]|uniref:hypothetical protein n=1 Tax=Bdellovibrio sp. HCB290 TaxID=3394356 RepID=UPI0039B572A2
MKKAFIIGMAITFSATAFAAPGKMTTPERLAKFDKQSQEYFLDANGNLKNASGKNAEKRYLEQAVKDIAPGKESKIVENALGDKEVLKNLVSIAAVKKAADKIEDRNEATELAEGAEGLASMIGNMHLAGKASSRENTPEQSSVAVAAYSKMLRLGTQILTVFKGAERTAYVKVIKAFKAREGNGKLAEENLIDAVMETQKVSREKAIEILKKLKDCVA